MYSVNSCLQETNCWMVAWKNQLAANSCLQFDGYSELLTTVEHQKRPLDGLALMPNGPRFGLSVVAARTVHVCAKSVRILNFCGTC